MTARTGLDFPETIDLIARDPRGAVVLIIVAPEQWTEGEGQKLLQLQDKINHYAEYVGSGQLAKRMPRSWGQPVTILLRAMEEPTPAVVEFVRRADEMLREHGISMEYEVAEV